MLKRILLSAAACILLAGCSAKGTAVSKTETPENSLKLEYAKQFTAEYVDNGCTLVTIGEDRYMVVPEGKTAPSDYSDAAVIQQPLECVYNAASSAMDLIDGAGALDRVSMTSTKYEDWCLSSVREAIDSGDISYIGKYGAPDYEALLEMDCGLAIESTMIYHSPEVREQIEALGIPVLVERSSYEKDPLGRMEWIKLYGILFGCEEQAEQLFDEKTKLLGDILTDEKSGKTAAFFYINSSGGVVVRKPSDYVPEMRGYGVFGGNGVDEISSLLCIHSVFAADGYQCDVAFHLFSLGSDIRIAHDIYAPALYGKYISHPAGTFRMERLAGVIRGHGLHRYAFYLCFVTGIYGDHIFVALRLVGHVSGYDYHCIIRDDLCDIIG